MESTTLIQLQEQPTLTIRGQVRIEALGAAYGERLRALRAYLLQEGLRVTGAPFVRYHTFGAEETDVELGVPIAQEWPGRDEIKAGHLPGGPALVTEHVGAHVDLGKAYQRVRQAMTAEGFTPNGPAWEVYEWIDVNEDPERERAFAASEGHTRLVQPLLEEVQDE
ncbi:GyrI-like domain-containing protein [Deinococcus aluminii]|uniref:GyrI-like small molecule binding domain-containing protein n=1 Tax=Deinococcus aluminii TaxID=1656885 RepID=A0ABP9XDN6_9DEIO